MRVFRKARARAPVPAPGGTEGRLIYAIGDVHGRADLLKDLVQKILEDADFCDPPGRPLIIFLGDYVDRGPDSREVIEQMLALRTSGVAEVVGLKGNHEEAFLLFLTDPSFGPTWMAHGGGATLASYGVQPPLGPTPQAWIDAHAAFVLALPTTHAEFLKELRIYLKVGGYVFVHAGVRPGVPLERQSERDLLWIRQEFLAAERALTDIVVHGHTPEPRPYSGSHRIGVDTGAYATGTLSAVRLLENDRCFIASSAHVAARRQRSEDQT